MSIEHRRIRVGDVELAIDEAGTGGRPLLLIHGFTGCRTDFEMALEPLAGLGWHVVAPDLRGHGLSDHPPAEEDYTLDRFADDVAGLAAALGFARFTILGHSMGGMVVQTLVLRDPSPVDGLILMDTSHGPLDFIPLDLIKAVADVARTEGMGAVADLMADQPILDSPAYQRAVAADPTYAARGDTNRRAASPAMFATMGQALITQDDRLPDLATLAIPTLVLVGEEDEPFRGPSDAMAAAIPGAQLAVVAGGGHSPQFEAHDGWWAALSTFLATIPA